MNRVFINLTKANLNSDVIEDFMVTSPKSPERNRDGFFVNNGDTVRMSFKIKNNKGSMNGYSICDNHNRQPFDITVDISSGDEYDTIRISFRIPSLFNAANTIYVKTSLCQNCATPSGFSQTYNFVAKFLVGNITDNDIRFSINGGTMEDCQGIIPADNIITKPSSYRIAPLEKVEIILITKSKYKFGDIRLSVNDISTAFEISEVKCQDDSSSNSILISFIAPKTAYLINENIIILRASCESVDDTGDHGNGDCRVEESYDNDTKTIINDKINEVLDEIKAIMSGNVNMIYPLLYKIEAISDKYIADVKKEIALSQDVSKTVDDMVIKIDKVIEALNHMKDSTLSVDVSSLSAKENTYRLLSTPLMISCELLNQCKADLMDITGIGCCKPEEVTEKDG